MTVETRPGLALEMSGLTVRLRRGPVIVEDVDLRLARGEILGVVGESGSGKTTAALSLLGFSSDGTEISSGEFELGGEKVRTDDSLRALRGSVISYVPQDPGRALNPALRIADAIIDVATAHTSRGEGDELAARMLEAVGLPSTVEFRRRFPHQISGGQQQRVLIAMALVGEPAVIVLDEPTTGLDVITQARILSLLERLRDEQGISMVYVTHDLAVVTQIADRIAVMYAGRVVEQGSLEKVLGRPRHPYTRGLLASIPDHARPRVLDAMPGIAVGVGERPTGCSFRPRCELRIDPCAAEVPALSPTEDGHLVRCFCWERTPEVNPILLQRQQNLGRGGRETVLRVEELRAEHVSHHGEAVVAAANISFAVDAGACVALVGESGSGKTTIARAIAGLHPIAHGRVKLGDQEVPSLAARRSVEQRRRIQLVFQSAAEALNPRRTVRDSVGRPAQVLRGLGRQQVPKEVERLLESVRLPARIADRYPGELSGGERQRVAIARALAADPAVILCDEITSALDVSVQAAVLQVLNDLRRDFGLALLFITHDLGVVATVADEVLVLENGLICERGAAAQVLDNPTDPYTRRLLAAAPSVVEVMERRVAATVPSAPATLGPGEQSGEPESTEPPPRQ
jgi:peptide/nickel transport system ATP-binding protein